MYKRQNQHKAQVAFLKQQCKYECERLNKLVMRHEQEVRRLKKELAALKPGSAQDQLGALGQDALGPGGKYRDDMLVELPRLVLEACEPSTFWSRKSGTAPGGDAVIVLSRINL